MFLFKCVLLFVFYIKDVVFHGRFRCLIPFCTGPFLTQNNPQHQKGLKCEFAIAKIYQQTIDRNSGLNYPNFMGI